MIEAEVAAKVLARLGLVTATCWRGPGGHAEFTPAADLADVTASQVIAVPLTATPPLPAGVPAEAWAHLALYSARPDAGAIARAQPASGFAAAATAGAHGQAAWLGGSVPVHDSAFLLRSPELAERAARLLAVGEAVLLCGNGAITLGATPGLAVARMWVLAAACEVYLAARGVRETMGTGFGTPYSVTPLSADEIASWRAAGDELLPRLWQHLRRR